LVFDFIIILAVEIDWTVGNGILNVDKIGHWKRFSRENVVDARPRRPLLL